MNKLLNNLLGMYKQAKMNKKAEKIVVDDYDLISQVLSMTKNQKEDEFSIATLSPEKDKVLGVKYIKKAEVYDYKPNQNEYALVGVRDTGFIDTDYQLQPMSMVVSSWNEGRKFYATKKSQLNKKAEDVEDVEDIEKWFSVKLNNDQAKEFAKLLKENNIKNKSKKEGEEIKVSFFLLPSSIGVAQGLLAATLSKFPDKQASTIKKAEEDLIEVGWGLETSDEDMIKSIAEDTGRKINKNFWDKINKDIDKVESWFLREGYKKFFTKVRDEGHGKYNELGGTAWMTKQQLEDYISQAEKYDETTYMLLENTGSLYIDINHDDALEFHLFIYVDDKDLDEIGIESKKVSKNKKQSSKKARKSLHKKAISGFNADVMEINERKLEEIRNTAKDMGDEIWARINEDIVKIIAYGYDYGKLKIVYREPYYDKEEIEEMYENADEVSLADFETLELQREAKISHKLTKKAGIESKEERYNNKGKQILKILNNLQEEDLNKTIKEYRRTLFEQKGNYTPEQDELRLFLFDIHNQNATLKQIKERLEKSNIQNIRDILNLGDKQSSKSKSMRKRAFKRLCLKRAFHKTAGEFEEMMKLKSTDPKLISYLAKEFGVEESTVSQYTDVSENAEELYNILDEQANKYGFEWDKFEYDEYGDRIDEDDFRGDPDDLEKAVEYLKNNIDKSMFKFEYVGTYEDNYLTFSVNEKLIPTEKPIIHIKNDTTNYDISFFAESQQSKEEDKAEGIASDDSLTILIRRTSDEILNEIINYVNVELPKKIEEQNKKQSSKTKSFRKQAKYEETVQGDEKIKDSAKSFGLDIKFAGHYGRWIYYYLIDNKGNIIRDDKEYQKVYDEMKKRIDDDIEIKDYGTANLVETIDGELVGMPTIAISEYTLSSNHKDREENTGLEEFKRDFNLSSSTKKQAERILTLKEAIGKDESEFKNMEDIIDYMNHLPFDGRKDSWISEGFAPGNNTIDVENLRNGEKAIIKLKKNFKSRYATRQNRLSKSATIKHENGVYNVYSESGKCLGKGYKTKEEAEKRLKQVEYFKHKNASRIDWEFPGYETESVDSKIEWLYTHNKNYNREQENNIYKLREFLKNNQELTKDDLENILYELKHHNKNYKGDQYWITQELTVDEFLNYKKQNNKPNKRTSLKQVVISKMAKIKK